MTRKPSNCLTCGIPLSTRRPSLRCRACANILKPTQFSPQSAKAAVTRREALRRAERLELDFLRGLLAPALTAKKED